MKTAEIYYKKNILTPTPSEETPNPERYWGDNKDLYEALKDMGRQRGKGQNKEQVTIDKEWFKGDNGWVKVSEEEVKSSRSRELETIWKKYQRYETNPLSAQNDGRPGKDYQPTIDGKGVGHTTMTIGDVIKIEDRYYIVADHGFLRLYLS